jgi:hypothetical protein
MTSKCFKCEKEIDSAVITASPWDCPSAGVLFTGGDSYGSTIYDSLINGIRVQIIICDECLLKNKNLLNETTSF